MTHSDLVNETSGLIASDEPSDILELLDRATCLGLLAGIDVGRVAWAEGGSAGGTIMVFPLNFVVDGDEIVMRTSSDVICAQVAAKHRLTFQADDFEPAIRCGWTVLASGPVEVVTEPAEVERLAGLVHPWRGESNLRVLRLHVESMTGRRLQTRPGTIETVRVGP